MAKSSPHVKHMLPFRHVHLTEHTYCKLKTIIASPHELLSLTLPFLMEIYIKRHLFYWFLRTRIHRRFSRCYQHTGQQLGPYMLENSRGKYTTSVKKKITDKYNKILYTDNQIFSIRCSQMV
jgi:hypothetical protein